MHRMQEREAPSNAAEGLGFGGGLIGLPMVFPLVCSSLPSGQVTKDPAVLTSADLSGNTQYMVLCALRCPNMTSVRIPFGAWATICSMRASIKVNPKPWKILNDTSGKLLAESRAREARTSERTPAKDRKAHCHLPKLPNLYLDPEGKQKNKSPKPANITKGNYSK